MIQWIAYQTILLNELRRTFRIWPQTLLPSAITTVLYFLIFGHLMGQRIGNMNGIPYINFIMPGLIMMNMIMAAYNAAVAVLYMAKWNRSIEEMLVSSMSATNMVLAFMSAGILRGLIVGLIVSVVAEAFTHVGLAHIGYLLFIVLFSCAIFSLLGVINALLAKTFDQISIIPTFVITPLSYLGGVFYSITILPFFWQKAAMFNPILYLVNSLRYAFLGHSDISVAWSSLFIIAVFMALFYTTWRLFITRVGFSD